MSWSINVVGTPEKIAAKLEEESAKMTGQSKVEFDDAKPHLVALVTQNFGTSVSNGLPVIGLIAAGSGSAAADGTQLNRSCTVKIERLYTELLA